MNTLILLVTLACPDVHMVNTSGEAWTSNDYDTIEIAKVRCGEIFPDAPCLIKFEKYAFQSYRTTCGKKR